MESWPAKDPDEILDYQFDWTDRLESETIATSQWIVGAGTVVILTNPPHDPSIVGAITTVWLSGGTLNENCEITNRITTSAQRTRDYSAKIKIKAK